MFHPTTPLDLYPIKKEAVIGNVLYDMQELHFAFFKNKRKNTLCKKMLNSSVNKKLIYSNPQLKISSKKVFNSILSTTLYLLSKNRLEEQCNIDKNKIKMDFRQTNCFTNDKNNSVSHFNLHKDDYHSVATKCMVVVYYLRKDLGIKGGNFGYNANKNTTLLTIENINKGDVLIFKGNLLNLQQHTYGIGCIDIISVYIPLK